MGGVGAGEVTKSAAVGLGGHTGQLARDRIVAPGCDIYIHIIIINTAVVRATRNMDGPSREIYIYPRTCPVLRRLGGGIAPRHHRGGGSPPESTPEGHIT